jgi:orotate phosphoribosyltransferase
MEPLRLPTAPTRFEANLMRTKVFNLIKERSFFRERMTLASGKVSDFYFDMKPTMFSPEGAKALSAMILEKLQKLNVDYVGGLELGAVPLISTITMLSHGSPREIPGFFVRKNVKSHGTKKLVDGLAAGETLRGKRVVILEDVTTTGGSAMVAVDAARQSGAEVIMVLSVVDRGEGAAEYYKEAGIAFECLFTAAEFLNAPPRNDGV